MNRRDFFKAALGTAVGVSVLSVARNIMSSEYTDTYVTPSFTMGVASSSESYSSAGYHIWDTFAPVKENILHVGSKILLMGAQSQVTRVRAEFLPSSDQWSWIPGAVHWHIIPVPVDKSIDWLSQSTSQVLMTGESGIQYLYIMAEKLPKTTDQLGFGLGNIWLVPLGHGEDMLPPGQYQYLEIPGTREPRRFRYPITG